MATHLAHHALPLAWRRPSGGRAGAAPTESESARVPVRAAGALTRARH